ncbi:hypothetical protein HHK36_032625 [Tetracentron sinense]|uniref:Dirigent protein n=1 Tax=Tetracentron sinense TaxID=13715 RepID=A0A834Y8W7_TETSI|nr:hypothetical protein HHK36_032625 [Tetracentron sinense]
MDQLPVLHFGTLVAVDDPVTEGPDLGSKEIGRAQDLFLMKEREFGIVSGTGFFRFVKGYAVMETEFMDSANLRAVLKLNVTVKHN